MKIKKIATLALGLTLALGMTTTAFAAGSSNPDNPAAGSQITIEKNLKVSNPDLDSVAGPGLTMNYAIAPVAPAADNGGTTITDAQKHTGAVHQGPADGVTLSADSISWAVDEAVDASAAGADNVKSITADVDLSKFSVPGIYRYELSETVGTDTSATGAAGETRYIDVYIANAASGTGLEVKGVVMHDGQTANGKPANKATFGEEKFETVNIELEKEVTGNMGDKNNQFPFTATTSDHGRYHYAKKAEAPTAIEGNKKAEGTESTTLKHGEKYYISGLSKNTAKIAYEETNNTQDVYQTSITGGTPSAASAVAAGSKKAMDSTDVKDAASVKFTNNLDEVSPTGVVLRFGAPLLVLIAGGILLVMNRKAKNQPTA